jgi:23S rRNA pseudouridine1911/1915/1917 synthase
MRQYKVPQKGVGVRVDVFLSSKYPQYSRSALSKLFSEGQVELNDSPAKAGDKLRIGDKIGVDESKLIFEPETIVLPVVYEDEDVVVINKPAGMLTHSKGVLNTEATVAGFVADKIRDKELTGNRAGIVHRLDRGTSGVMIAAKTAKAQKFLQKQFSDRKVGKVYKAIVEGTPNTPAAIIDAPIERNPKRPQTFRVGAGGKSAKTEYKILEDIDSKGRRYSMLELRPVTGRTHQLRVHLAYIGHPVVGDALYGHDADDGMLLHAESLQITLPSGERRAFTAPLPESFSRFTHENK